MTFYIKLKICVIAIFITACSDTKDNEVTLTFSGDVMLDRGVAKAALSKERGYLFSNISTLYQYYDYNIINLEGVLTEKQHIPANKRYVFKAKPFWAKEFYKGQITHVTLANNHSLDYGEFGLKDTKEALTNAEISFFGDSCIPEIIEQNENTILLFSYTNLIQDDKQLLCSSEHEFIKSIQEFKQRYPESIIITVLHWGTEYVSKAMTGQRKLAHKLIDNKVDMVIGHHPHVIQNIEYYKEKPIFYSLGNLIFDQNRPNTDLGGIVGVRILQNKIKQFDFYPVRIKKSKPHLLDSTALAALKTRNVFSETNLETKPYGWSVSRKKEKSFIDFSKSVSIEDANFKGTISVGMLKHIAGFKLSVFDESHKEKDKKLFKYQIYNLQKGDINNDGFTDIALGVIKSTKFHPEMAKRLFTFQIKEGKIRPLWLGSELSYTLHDFRVVKEKDTTYVYALESDEKFVVGKYIWKGFGLTLKHYIAIDLSKAQGEELLNKLSN